MYVSHFHVLSPPPAHAGNLIRDCPENAGTAETDSQEIFALEFLHRFKSDEALMLAYQRGDASAFESLYRRHKDGFFAFLYRSCPRRAAAEDIAQEAWEAVIKSAATYRPEASFKTWLYQIGRHRVADYFRRRGNHAQSLEDIAEPVDDGSAADFPQTEQKVLQAVGRLPRDQRDAVLLKEQGFTLAEISEITAAGQETVKSRLRYGREQLRRELGEIL